MENKTVQLVLVAKTENGWRRLPVVIGGNGKLRAGYGVIDGKPRHFPASRYALRTYQGAKQVFTSLGADATKAMAELKRQEHRLNARNAVAKAADMTLVDTEAKRLDLHERKEAWLKNLTARGKIRAVEHMTLAIDEFMKETGHSYADEINEESMTTYYSALRARTRKQKDGTRVAAPNSDRTIFNKAVDLSGWFKFMKLDVKSIIPQRPTFTKKEVQIYEAEDGEISALLKACRSTYFKTVLQVLHMTGVRMQEAMFMEWGDVDFQRNEIHITEKLEDGFRIKDGAERSIRMPPVLKTVLLQWQKKRPKARWVLATSGNQPNWKMREALKRVARRAGLNCGNCRGCRSKNECRLFTLKKFRSTYTTTLLRSGMDPRSVMEQTGHEDIETVMLYWKPISFKQAAIKIDEIVWPS